VDYPTHGICSPSTFVRRDFVDGPLDLNQVQGLALQLYCIAQDSRDLDQLVLVARDEIKLSGGHCGSIDVDDAISNHRIFDIQSFQLIWTSRADEAGTLSLV
jgi:hypothetical protein